MDRPQVVSRDEWLTAVPAIRLQLRLPRQLRLRCRRWSTTTRIRRRSNATTPMSGPGRTRPGQASSCAGVTASSTPARRTPVASIRCSAPNHYGPCPDPTWQAAAFHRSRTTTGTTQARDGRCRVACPRSPGSRLIRRPPQNDLIGGHRIRFPSQGDAQIFDIRPPLGVANLRSLSLIVLVRVARCKEAR
jgi:hypothetical protein